jgi:hypothetical protein
MNKEAYRPLARYLRAAYVAHKLDIAPSSALKQYVPHDPGAYWFHLAERMDRQMDKIADRGKEFDPHATEGPIQ